MTRLRKLMLDELERRNYAKATGDAYIHALKEFSNHYHRPPDQLGPNQISQFQLHLLRDLKLSPQTVKQHMAAPRFFFVHTLKRHYPLRTAGLSSLPAPRAAASCRLRRPAAR